MDKEKPPAPFKVKGKREMVKCPFPNCAAMVDAPEPGKPPPACKRHNDFANDLVFALNVLGLITVSPDGKVQKEGPPGGPPGKQFFVPLPGQGDRAVKEAKQAAGEKLFRPGGNQ